MPEKQFEQESSELPSSSKRAQLAGKTAAWWSLISVGPHQIYLRFHPHLKYQVSPLYHLMIKPGEALAVFLLLAELPTIINGANLSFF